MKLLFFLSALLSCTQDYAVINSQEPETIIVTETITETETIEVEVPVYVEVEVPVNEGVIWVDSFTQHMSVDGIDIIWVIDRSGSMATHNDRLIAGVEAMIAALPTADWKSTLRENYGKREVLQMLDRVQKEKKKLFRRRSQKR